MRKIILGALKILGAVILVLIVWVAGSILWPLGEPAPNSKPQRLLVKNATVVDVESGILKSPQDILVIDGVISLIGTINDTTNAHVIDATGQYAIPGLFDMHTHSMKMTPSITHPLYIANGITAVRDMGGCIGLEETWAACVEDKKRWNTAVAEGTMVGPRYDRITGLAINGGNAIPEGVDALLGAATPEGAVARVAFDKARGLDFLKTYTMLPKDSYLAMADAARSKGMTLEGHLPLSVSAIEAVGAGQRSIEHAVLFIWECYPEFDAIRDKPDFFDSYTNALRLQMIKEHDASLCDDIFTAMAEAGTAYVPTHTTRKMDAFAHDDTYRNDPRLKYIPQPLRQMWSIDANGMVRRAKGGDVSGQVSHSFKDFYEFGLELTGRAHRAGVTVLAGTDAMDSYAFPGFALADELEHLVQAGLSPLDALRAATVEPAKFMALEGKAGVIAVGARADIVLLNENPLDDINAVREMETVVLAGVPYDRGDLDGLLADVEDRVNSLYMWPKFFWSIAMSPIMRRQFKD